MPTYTIKLLLPAENEYGMDETEQIVADLNAAINDHGLLGGSFLVTEVAADESEFWSEWTKRSEQARVSARLEYLRGEIRAERISYGELAELQGLADKIAPGDVELLEWAGVPESDPA